MASVAADKGFCPRCHVAHPAPKLKISLCDACQQAWSARQQEVMEERQVEKMSREERKRKRKEEKRRQRQAQQEMLQREVEDDYNSTVNAHHQPLHVQHHRSYVSLKNNRSAIRTTDVPSKNSVPRADTDDQQNASPASFRIMTYNMLADYLIRENSYLYKNCRDIDLSWGTRCKKLLNEILFYAPTILCVQEAQEKHFFEDMLPVLMQTGNNYQLAVYKKRTSENKHDGCAILFRKDVLEVVDTMEVELFVKDHPVLDRDNVATLGRFRFIATHEEDFTNNKANPSKETTLERVEARDIVIATVHVMFNPKRGDVKIEQSNLLCKTLSEFIDNTNSKSKNKKIDDPAVFICGDFNSKQNSAIYHFFRNGLVNLTGIDYRKISHKNAMSK